MRRTITLLVLLLCCTLADVKAGAAGKPKRSAATHAGQATAGVNDNRGKFIAALDNLKKASEGPQSNPDAVSLKRQILERLKVDYRSDAALQTLREDVANWQKTAEGLCRDQNLCDGPLAQRIKDAQKASNDYFIEPTAANTNADQPQGGEPPPAEHTGDTSGDKGPQVTDEQLRAEVRRVMSEENGGLLGWAKLAALVLTPPLALGLFAFAFVSIRKTRREVADLNNRTHQAFLSLRTKHDALVKMLEGLTASDADLFTRLAELSAEIGAVDGRMRGLKATAVKTHPDGDGLGPPPPPQPELPAFPVTADAYLRKMQRHATVVKPDFQNGILIADPENKGELVLVQDTSISHDTLFVVPRATQFQMKQDFYTYYERYYECERPASGTVWIVDPAVVERVQGGWELREKGVLEVR